MDAEAAHHWAGMLIRALPKLGLGRLLKVWTRPDPALTVRALGLTFPSPLGVAAGFDKDARMVVGLGQLGFGHVEVGTITALAQPGNERPRLFRLLRDRAIINRMGFNNAGADVAMLRLRRLHSMPVHRRPVIGVNIGKSRLTDVENAVDDYRRSARLLAPFADYLVVNVSSPNTPGLRDLQAVESLRPILAAVRDVATIPVLVKIAPDLDDADIDAVTDLVLELGLAGIVATNTTISRDGLRTPAAAVEALGAGGISGAPVAARSREVLTRIHGRAGGRIVIISVGGIETPEDVWDRITHGANLVQTYTGFIFTGPTLLRGTNRLVAKRLRQGGFGSLAEAVGSAVR
jgi:dihydroorotate dehydrogenase